MTSTAPEVTSIEAPPPDLAWPYLGFMALIAHLHTFKSSSFGTERTLPQGVWLITALLCYLHNTLKLITFTCIYAHNLIYIPKQPITSGVFLHYWKQVQRQFVGFTQRSSGSKPTAPSLSQAANLLSQLRRWSYVDQPQGLLPLSPDSQSSFPWAASPFSPQFLNCQPSWASVHCFLPTGSHWKPSSGSPRQLAQKYLKKSPGPNPVGQDYWIHQCIPPSLLGAFWNWTE